MDELSEQGFELYIHHGVLVKSLYSSKEEDSQCSGTLSIIEYKSLGKCIEWKPTDVSVESETQDQEWAMVNADPRRIRTASTSSFDGYVRARPFRIELSDLKSFHITRNSQQIALMQRDGTTHCSLFFQHGNADSFVSALRGILPVSKSKKMKNLYMILDEPKDQVQKSFAELELFQENTSDMVWKFVRNLHQRPVETTLEAFSKLTDVLLYKPIEQSPIESDVAELFNRSLTLDETATEVAGEEYAVIRIGRGSVLPPRPEITRGEPLSVEQWTQSFDEDGRILEPDKILQIIFKGGITESLQFDVWKFLLGYYPWNLTYTERVQLRKKKIEEYFQMKLQWRSMTQGQESRFSDYRERKSLIEKDVNRTDRTIPFFAGDNNPNLQLLSDILMTYVMYNFDLGYVQGMSDLLSPILCLMKNEVDSFWCFVGFMDKVFSNFELDQAGMKQQLSQLHLLLSVVEPELAAYLEQHDSSNMFFCFRWLLVLFKREFSYCDIMRLWEVLWTELPCQNFHLLICIAILDTEKNILMENGYGFTEILKTFNRDSVNKELSVLLKKLEEYASCHINDLSLHIKLDDILCKAEGIYHQLASASKLSDIIRLIIGLEPLGDQNVANADETCNGLTNGESDGAEEQSSLETVSLSTNGEVAFERSLNLNYL